MHKKVLFILKKRYGSYCYNGYGIAVGLINSVKFTANALNKARIESKIAQVVDENSIDKEVHHNKPTHVMIEALWVTPKKMQVLIKKYPKIQWVIRLHSKAPFLAMEGVAFQWINGYTQLGFIHKNIHISTNNKDFNEELEKGISCKSLYLPNIYCPPKYEENNFPFIEKLDGEIHIGCFGAIRPMKNQILQALSAITFANDLDLTLIFHINSNRIEQLSENVLKNIKALFDFPSNTRHRLVEHSWMNHGDFICLVKQMDIGMQVSYSESFNIVTADFANNNVPIVVSNDISWMPVITKCDPNSGKEMVEILKKTYNLSLIDGQIANKFALYWYNYHAIKTWKKYIKN